MTDDTDFDPGLDRQHQPTSARLPMLGLGWDFPVRLRAVDDGRTIAAAADEVAVCRAIALVLGTVRGERAMRPDFGSRLHQLVFAPNTSTTRAAAEHEVRDALLRNEPRIDVLDVAATSAGPRGEMIMIDIAIRVRGTDNRFNMVYPFYLERTREPGETT